MQEFNKEFLTIQDLATLYGLSKHTQNKYRMLKKIPYIKIGSKIFYEKVKFMNGLKAML